ncbi:MAG: SLC13 family permease [Peptococcales bacterium]|jgi:sodium-dependent dicarboxylate transporter 2/3/5
MKKRVVVILLLIALLFSFTTVAFAGEVSVEEAAAKKHKQAVTTLIILGVAAVLFITEIIPLAVTAMAVPVVLSQTGVVSPKEAFSGLYDSNVIIFAGMFVVGAALFETGVAQKIGDAVVRKAGTSEIKLALGVMVMAAALSSVLSNTGTTAVLLPVAIGIANSAGWSRSKVLMPLAFAAGLGGVITLVGTPPNLLVNGVLGTSGLREFGFFEFAFIGIPLTVVGIIYMLTIGRKLLPDRPNAPDDNVQNNEVKEVSTIKQYTASGILIGVVIVMAFFSKIIPLHVAATVGALLCIITGTLTEKQAYRSIDWTTIFLFAGMLSLASAMATTGAGKLIADFVINLIGEDANPYLIMTAMFFLSAGLSQFMSNTATAALLAPIGLAIANGLGASPHAILMIIGVAASCAFATPVGTPPNTLVLGPANLRFLDYVKVGLPLIFVCYIVSIIIIPLVWPLY